MDFCLLLTKEKKIKKSSRHVFLLCYNSIHNKRGDAHVDVIELTSNLTLYILLTVAVIQDFKKTRVSNRLILIGLLFAVCFRILGDGAEHIIWILPNIIFPVIVLYLFYLMGALGAGDIKLFSLIGGFVNFKELVECICISIIIGAVAGLIKLLYSGIFLEQIKGGGQYFIGLLSGDIHRYQAKSKENIIHFSLYITLGLICVQIYESGIFRLIF